MAWEFREFQSGNPDGNDQDCGEGDSGQIAAGPQAPRGLTTPNASRSGEFHIVKQQ